MVYVPQSATLDTLADEERLRLQRAAKAAQQREAQEKTTGAIVGDMQRQGEIGQSQDFVREREKRGRMFDLEDFERQAGLRREEQMMGAQARQAQTQMELEAKAKMQEAQRQAEAERRALEEPKRALELRRMELENQVKEQGILTPDILEKQRALDMEMRQADLAAKKAAAARQWAEAKAAREKREAPVDTRPEGLRVTKQAMTELQKDHRAVESTLIDLVEIRDLIKQNPDAMKYFGGEGSVLDAMRSWVSTLPPEARHIRAKLSAFENKYFKENSGAAVTDSEAKRNYEAIPNKTDRAADMMIKLDSSIEKFQQTEARVWNQLDTGDVGVDHEGRTRQERIAKQARDNMFKSLVAKTENIKDTEARKGEIAIQLFDALTAQGVPEAEAEQELVRRGLVQQ